MVEDALALVKTLTQQILANEKEFSDQELEKMWQVLQRAVEFLEGQEITTAGTPIDIKQGEFPSSNVEGFKYDPDTKEMFVQFHGPYPNAKGPIYSYGNVPPFLYDIISKGRVAPKTSGKSPYHDWQKGVSPSLGASVYALLRDNFPYQKVG